MDVVSYLLGKKSSGGGSTEKITPKELNLSGSVSDTINTQMIDISNLTTLANMFQNCTNVEVLDLTGWNFENIISVSNIFNGCTKLKTVKIDEIYVPNAVAFTNAFSNCPSLEDIPYINAPKTTSFSGLFSAVGSNLTEKSLDNVLRTCISAVSYTKTKTLVAIGFTSDKYPATRISALPHYQEFINAGWSIGY